MGWLSKYSSEIQTGAALITAFVALAALVGVKFQLDASDTQQRAQSAREAYRSHLALASTLPNFAKPANNCKVMRGPKSGAYFAFVDHLLYSAEQMLETEPGWETTFTEALQPHNQYFCSESAPRGNTAELQELLATFKTNHCEKIRPCP